MIDPFEMKFMRSKRTISNRLNKPNRRSESAVSNSGVKKTSLKFDGRNAIAPHKL